VITAHGPTNRSIVNLARNLPFAWRVVRRLDPDVILSTGAGAVVAVWEMDRLAPAVASVSRPNSSSSASNGRLQEAVRASLL
jgi:hypothetical protein